jgi:hypothetical protein
VPGTPRYRSVCDATTANTGPATLPP